MTIHRNIGSLLPTVILLLSAFGQSAAQDWQQFWPAGSIFPAGDDGRSVTVGDFDEDGNMDLAIANESGINVAVLSGRGDGSFTTMSQIAMGGRPLSIVSGDFNEDGHLDLATANSFDNEIAVVLGAGNGLFTGPMIYTAGSVPRSIEKGDFDNDGHLDLVTANRYSDNVAVFRGIGDGTFSGPTFDPAGDRPTGVAIGDFNEDGKTDLAVSDRTTGEVALLLGNGNGGFQNPTFWSAIDTLSGIAVGDFDRDGHHDVVVFSSDPGNLLQDVAVLLGNGTGSLYGPTTYSIGVSPYAVSIGDFDEDSDPDLLFTQFNGQVSLLIGQGDGTFAGAIPFHTDDDPYFTAIGDFDKDGHEDLATVGGYSTYGSSPNSVTILLGDGEGSFYHPAAFDAGGNGTDVAIDDFDEDGHADLAILSRYNTDQQISIVRGVGDGTFSSPELVGLDMIDPTSITSADFNNDGHADLAAVRYAYYPTDNLYVYLGMGDGSFAHLVTIPAGVNSMFVESGDFDGDGNMDLVTVDKQNYEYNASILLGSGDGYFSDPAPYPIDAEPTHVVIDDFNEDGHADLAFTAIYPGNLSILLGTGDGSFGNATLIPVNGNLYRAASGDLDGDGHTDVAATDPWDDQVVFFPGTGTGGFDTPVYLAVNPSLSRIVAADFDRDGWLDLTGDGPSSVSVLFGTGPLSFDPYTYAVGPVNGETATGDFNEDGLLDIVSLIATGEFNLLLGRPREFDVDIDSPVDSLPAGEILPIHLAIENLTDSAMTVDLRIRVKIVGGSEIPFGPRRLTVPGGQGITISPNFPTPAGTLPQTYIASIEADALDGRVLDEDSFRVVVIRAEAGISDSVR